MFGIEAYPGPSGKAAALLHSPVPDRPLVDGDERLAWVRTPVLLDMNGADTADIDRDRAYGLVVGIAAGEPEEVSLITDSPRALRAEL
jgi:death-on-curing protein